MEAVKDAKANSPDSCEVAFLRYQMGADLMGPLVVLRASAQTASLPKFRVSLWIVFTQYEAKALGVKLDSTIIPQDC